MLLHYDGAAQRRIRRAQGVRSEDLSAITRRSSTMLRAYETGAAEPKVSTAALIAAALGVPLSDLLAEVPADAPREVATEVSA